MVLGLILHIGLSIGE